MKFQPKTENEVQSEGRIPKGEYDFEIAEASDEVSKKGNEMIKLKVLVFDDEGNPRTIFDYLLEEISYKLRHAAYACGLGGEYESGALQAQDFIGKAGRCKVIIQKDKSGQYPDKNVIQDYIVPDVTAGGVESVETGAMINDSVPF